MSLGEKLRGRKKKGHTDRTIHIHAPPGSRFDPKMLQACVDLSTGQCQEELASVVDALMAESEPDVLNPRYPLFNIRAHRRLRQVMKGGPLRVHHVRMGPTNVLTLMTNRIVESTTLDGGVVMIDEVTASRVGFRQGWDAKVSYAGRSVPMRLMISGRLSLGEVELCRAAIDELGISEGSSGWLMVSAIPPAGWTKGSTPSETDREVSVAPREGEPDRSEAAFDDSLPYEVETGWRPFKRLRRK